VLRYSSTAAWHRVVLQTSTRASMPDMADCSIPRSYARRRFNSTRRRPELPSAPRRVLGE